MDRPVELDLGSEGPKVDSRILANGLGIQHSSIIKIIYRYQSDFEDFGILEFKKETNRKQGQPRVWVILNESHAIFLLTLCRPTPQVVELTRKMLTKSFARYRTCWKRDAVES